MAEPEPEEPAAAAADEELPDVDVFEQAMDLAGLNTDATHSKHLIFGSSKWKVWCAAQLQNAGFNVDEQDKEMTNVCRRGISIEEFLSMIISDEDLFVAYMCTRSSTTTPHERRTRP